MSEFDYFDQSYVQDMLRHLADIRPGEVRHVMIEHDDWCPALLGTGYCICHPNVRSPKREELRWLRQMERQTAKKKGGAS